MAFTFVTVNEQYGPGAIGTVAFALDRPMSNGGDAAGLGASWVATPDGSGNISISLPSTLDPNNRTSSGTTDARMRVHERINGGNRVYYVPIPTSGPVDLGSLTRTDDSLPTTGLVLPVPVPGTYVPLTGSSSVSTSNTLVNGTLRLAPIVITAPVRFDRLGADVSAAGEAGSKFRLGIYADTGFCFPGALLLDAGQIAGDSATVQDAPALSLYLPPGLYWGGGAVQSASTTQPTMRVINNWVPPVLLAMSVGSLPSAAAAPQAYAQTGVTGALPSVFAGAATASFAMARIHARLA
jgi:hypothetical protein